MFTMAFYLILLPPKALAGGIPIGTILQKRSACIGLATWHNFWWKSICYRRRKCWQNSEQENIAEQATEKGIYMMDLLKKKTARNPDVLEVKGMGLMIGVG